MVAPGAAAPAASWTLSGGLTVSTVSSPARSPSTPGPARRRRGSSRPPAASSRRRPAQPRPRPLPRHGGCPGWSRPRCAPSCHRGRLMGEYADLARRLSRAPGVAGIEVNLSPHRRGGSRACSTRGSPTTPLGSSPPYGAASRPTGRCWSSCRPTPPPSSRRPCRPTRPGPRRRARQRPTGRVPRRPGRRPQRPGYRADRPALRGRRTLPVLPGP